MAAASREVSGCLNLFAELPAGYANVLPYRLEQGLQGWVIEVKSEPNLYLGGTFGVHGLLA